MKSFTLSLALLAALASAQSTVTEDYTATISFKTFYKHRSSSAVSSGPGASGSVTSSGASVSPTGSVSSSGQVPSSGIIPSSGVIPSSGSSNTASITDTSSQFTVPSISSSFIYSNTSSNALGSGAALPTISAAGVGASTTSAGAGAQYTSGSSASTSATSSSSSISSSTTLNSATASAILAEHNNKRDLHVDTPALAWSDDLSAWAYDYVNSLAGTEYDPCSGNLKHSSNRDNQGENIAFGTYSSVEALVDYWYDEINDYDYNDVTGIIHDGQDVGHFTQLVWASSTQVGCAAVECPASNGLYLLCEYTPAGNVYLLGGDDTYEEFRENVLPLKSS